MTILTSPFGVVTLLRLLSLSSTIENALASLPRKVGTPVGGPVLTRFAVDPVTQVELVTSKTCTSASRLDKRIPSPGFSKRPQHLQTPRNTRLRTPCPAGV